MKNVAIVVANVQKALGFEWLAEFLDREAYRLHFFLLNPDVSPMEVELKARGVSCQTITYRGRRDAAGAVIALIRGMRARQIDIVHAHLVDAGLLAFAAAMYLRINRRLYTRHYSNLHWVYLPKGRRYDRVLNRIATDVIAVSALVRDILVMREGLPPTKAHLLHHGFDLSQFENVPAERVSVLRAKYGVDGHGPVVGVISRYTVWKGIQYIVPAFRRVLAKYPDAKLVLANAHGDAFAADIKRLLRDLPPESYTEIRFENDLPALYRLFDVFVHTPIDGESEAFGQTYVEALAAGIPAVFTLSGIAHEFITHEHNALVADYRDSESIYRWIDRVLADPTFAVAMVGRGRQSVARFDIRAHVDQLGKIYSGLS